MIAAIRTCLHRHPARGRTRIAHDATILGTFYFAVRARLRALPALPGAASVLLHGDPLALVSRSAAWRSLPRPLVLGSLQVLGLVFLGGTAVAVYHSCRVEMMSPPARLSVRSTR